MPKLTIEFNLPEEKEEFDITNKAMDYYVALSDFREHLRSIIKYTDKPESEINIYEEIREKFFEILNNNNIEL